MQDKQPSLIWLRYLCVIVLVLGIFFRFVNLDRKVYFGDEVYTSIRISGHTTAELVNEVANGNLSQIEDLQKYQQPSPEKGLLGTIEGLALEEPWLTPLYFVMARFWAEWFGSSIAATRSLVASISLLAFPAVYWLCLELFKSSIIGWTAIALIAVSPIHVLYAQEARMYSLWAVTILLASAALLRAMRSQTRVSWAIYALTLILSFYSYLLSVVIAIGHGFYVVVIEGFRWTKTVTAYLLASLAAILAFVPWLVIVVSDQTSNQSSLAFAGESVLHAVKHWAGNISRIFFDFNLTIEDTNKYIFPLIVIAILSILLLSGYSIYFLCRRTPKRVWLFVLVLILAIPIAMLPKGSLSSNFPIRYLIPSCVGIQLAVAYLLATQTTALAVNLRQKKLWRLAAIALISSGIISCALSSSTETWWNKQFGSCNPQIARIINQAKKPLIISDGDGRRYDSALSNIVSLSYLLDPKVQFQLVVEPNTPKIPDGFSDVFLVTPSETLRSNIQQESWQLQPIYKDRKAYRGSNICLWKLNKNV